MEKFTNPKRGHAPVGSIGIPLRYLSATKEHIFSLLLISSFSLVGGAVFAQPFANVTGPSNPLNAADAGNRSVPVFVDIDNDCDKDCFAGNLDGEVVYYKNTGTASAPVFTLQLNANNPLNGFAVSSNAKPAFIDIDADGDLDCFIGGGDGYIHAFENIGTADSPEFEEMTGPNVTFFDGNPFDGEDVGANASPGFIDFDKDGDYDCFVGRSNSSNSIRYFRNEGDENTPYFHELTGVENPLSNAAASVGANGNISSNACITFLDVDGDADMDCYVGITNGSFLYFRNTGSAFVFVANPGILDPTILDVSGSNNDYSSPTFVDVDADGDLDCFSGRNNGNFVFYRNTTTLITAPILTCKPSYLVTLGANGLATLSPAAVDPSDLFMSTTFNCPNELTYTVTGTGTLNFTCTDATNTNSSNGVATASYLTLTATDAALNMATCSTYVTVLDKTAPVPTVTPLPVLTQDICSITVTPPTATDVCTGPAMVTLLSPASIPTALGTHTLTWQYTDGHGNTGTQTQTLNVVSNTAPTWAGVCMTNIIAPMINQGAPNCGYLPSAMTPLWTVPTVSDCETIVSTSSSHTPLSFFPVGVTNVTYAAQDAGGNTGYCNFTVTVTDGVPPVVTLISPPVISGGPAISCGSSISRNSLPGQCGATVSWTPPVFTALDNCSASVTTSVSHASGSFFAAGVTPDTVRFTATDGSSSTVFCFFTVTVTDAQPPVITCPNSITIPTAPNSCTSATVNLTLPLATDNCSSNLVVTETTPGGPYINPRSVSSLPLGANTFSYQASDGVNAPVACSFTVNVVDQQAPTFGSTCPSNQVIAADGNGCTKTGSLWTVPTATDNCMSLTYVPTATLSGATTGSATGTPGMPVTSTVFNEGITTVTYMANDGAVPSNTVVCSFTIKVTNTIPPVPSCSPSPMVVAAGPTCTYTLGAIATSSATSPCDAGTVSYRTPAGIPLTVGTSTFVLGTHTVVAVATDVSGNSASCSVTIQVVDQTGPALQSGSCPGNITMNSDAAAACGANVTWSAPIWTDNCNNAGIVISRSAAPTNMATPNTATLLANNSGGFFPVGTTTVNFTAKDGSTITSNIGTPCGFTVTVIDDDKPVVSCPSAPVVVTAAAAIACNNVYTLFVPTVTDNGCSTALPVSYSVTGATTIANGPLALTATLNTGSNVITYSATDAASNTGTCSYVVQVKDLTGPVFSCPSNQIIVLTSGCSGAAANWMDPNMLIDCSPSPLPIGAPTIVSSTGLPAPTLNSSASARNGIFPVGITTLRYTAFDNASPSNSSTCNFTIDVRENTTPIITCPSVAQVIPTNSGCSANITLGMLTQPTASDNCGTATVTLASSLLSPFGVGSHLLSWVATDASGNSTMTSCSITVTDQTAPIISCPPALTLNTTPSGNCNVPVLTYTSTTALATATDNCTPSLPYLPLAPPGYGVRNNAGALFGFAGSLSVGTYNIQWTAQDAVGNTASCNQSITVRDGVLPLITCPANISVAASQPTCTVNNTTGFLGAPVFSDNCGGPSVVNNAGASFGVGTTTVVHTVTDAGGNTASCAQTVTVTCPASCTPTTTILTCPTTLTTQIDAPGCPASVSFTPASLGISAVDNCGNPVAVTASASTLTGTGSVLFSAGGPTPTSCTRTITVVLATEVCGNSIDDDCNPATSDVCSSPCSPDVSNPVFTSCPSTVTLNAETGEVFALSSNLPALNATDACPGVVTIENDAPPEIFDGDVISWTATDVSGNDALCVQTIIIITGGGGGGGCFDEANLSPEFALDGLSGDLYGSSMDIDGTLAVVGAPYDDNSKGLNSGAAYILSRNGSGGWDEVKKIVIPDGDADDLFGEAVAISGNTVAVGASQAFGRGVVYVFSKDEGGPNNWGLLQKLLASDGAAGDNFGASVDISASYVVVGALNDDAPQVNRGSFYIFEKDFPSANSWGERVRRSSSDGLTGDNFGVSVSIDGTTVVAGARYDDESGANSGAAFTFSKDFPTANNWGQTQKLLASDLAAGDYFGSSVAISGSNIVVGSYLEDNAGGNNAGSAYVFNLSAGTWTEIAKLTASDAAVADQFGSSVDIDGGTIIVGSQFDDDMGTNSGSAYIYTEDSGWAEVDKLLGSAVSTNDNFGRSVAVDGTYAGVGAYKDDRLSNLDQGSAYFFEDDCAVLRPGKALERSSNPVAAKFLHCFPNPSSDLINIDFTLEQEENVQIQVLNSMGQVVTTLFDSKASGENRLQWEGKQFGNGMYFIRVQAASIRETVPVVIVR